MPPVQIKIAPVLFKIAPVPFRMAPVRLKGAVGMVGCTYNDDESQSCENQIEPVIASTQ
jgi:hypothetical protein